MVSSFCVSGSVQRRNLGSRFCGSSRLGKDSSVGKKVGGSGAGDLGSNEDGRTC